MQDGVPLLKKEIKINTQKNQHVERKEKRKQIVRVLCVFICFVFVWVSKGLVGHLQWGG